MICCPVTTKKKGYPFEVVIKCKSGNTKGVALADHIKSLDWEARGVKKVGEVEVETLLHITAMLKALLMP